ncbi:hypothetical protein C8J57DRAFT_1522597 [Mycena rebaudengoi]|nr:hypothetical protein C8J57DRAFT_1522597 [Mycena rebaudengoi]
MPAARGLEYEPVVAIQPLHGGSIHAAEEGEGEGEGRGRGTAWWRGRKARTGGGSAPREDAGGLLKKVSGLRMYSFHLRCIYPASRVCVPDDWWAILSPYLFGALLSASSRSICRFFPARGMSCHRQAYIYHLFSLSPTLLLASPLFSSFYYVLFFSHNVNTPAGSLITANHTQYLIISYHKITDVESGRLRAPSSLPELASLDIAHTLLERGDFAPALHFDFVSHFSSRPPPSCSRTFTPPPVLLLASTTRRHSISLTSNLSNNFISLIRVFDARHFSSTTLPLPARSPSPSLFRHHASFCAVPCPSITHRPSSLFLPRSTISYFRLPRLSLAPPSHFHPFFLFSSLAFAFAISRSAPISSASTYPPPPSPRFHVHVSPPPFHPPWPRPLHIASHVVWSLGAHAPFLLVPPALPSVSFFPSVYTLPPPPFRRARPLPPMTPRITRSISAIPLVFTPHHCLLRSLVFEHTIPAHHSHSRPARVVPSRHTSLPLFFISLSASPPPSSSLPSSPPSPPSPPYSFLFISIIPN